MYETLIILLFLALILIALIFGLPAVKSGGSVIQKCAFAGSSSIAYFYNKTADNVFKFAGATMKGLGKPENTVRGNLLLICNDYENLILYFGEVDVLFSIYYDILRDKQDQMDSYINDFIKKRTDAYKKFIDAIKDKNPKIEITILLPWYNPIRPEKMLEWLHEHGTIDSIDDEINKTILPYLSDDFRKSLVDKFDEAIMDVCKEYSFIDVRSKILKDYVIDPIYISPNPLDHHLDWTFKKILIKEGLFNKCGIESRLLRKKPYTPKKYNMKW